MVLDPACAPGLVAASGELDISGAQPLVDAITATAMTVEHLTGDLGSVTFMDGAGLAALVDIRDLL